MANSGWEEDEDPLDDADFGEGYDSDGDESEELGREHDLGERGESASVETTPEERRPRESHVPEEPADERHRGRGRLHRAGVRIRPMPVRMAKRFKRAVTVTVTHRNGSQVIFVHPDERR
jgi:hypothetical protein